MAHAAQGRARKLIRMTMTTRSLRPFPVRRLAAALLLAAAGTAGAQAPFDGSPEARAALQRLASEDPQVQRARWGDLAAAAGKAWLHVAPGEVASVWRHPRWVVPGAVLRYHRGFCIATQCQGTDYLVQYNEGAKHLEFYENGSLSYQGRVQEDGSVRITGTGLVGVLTAETLRFDAANGLLFSDKHELKAGTGAQLAAASRGLAGDPAATAPAAGRAASEAELRAELDAMKAKVDALSRQVAQQGATAPAAPPAPALTPAQAREAERRAQREAAEAKKREEAERRAEAQARAREEAQAKAAEAKRAAEERKARAEAERLAAAEAKAAEQRRLAEEKQRLADEKRAREEVAKRAAEEAKAAKAAAAAAPVAAAAAAKPNACGGVDGVYGIVGGNYRIEVKFGDDVLMVREPNRESPYRHIGQCQFAFTHPNGTEYRLGVVPKALVAYKPGQSEAQKTQLALLQPAAAPQANNRCQGEEIPVLNPQALHPGFTRLFGTRSLAGVPLVGTYKAPERDGHPMTILEAGGGGTFEVYGAPAPQHVYRIASWHIQVNCDGTPVSETFPAATRYFLVFRTQPAYQGQEWHRMQYIVRPDRVSIDDRAKPR